MTRPKEIKLSNGTCVRPYFFSVGGFRMTIWARSQKEAIKRAKKLFGSNAIPQFGP
jgi:hypothetical protein